MLVYAEKQGLSIKKVSFQNCASDDLLDLSTMLIFNPFLLVEESFILLIFYLIISKVLVGW